MRVEGVWRAGSSKRRVDVAALPSQHKVRHDRDHPPRHRDASDPLPSEPCAEAEYAGEQEGGATASHPLQEAKVDEEAPHRRERDEGDRPAERDARNVGTDAGEREARRTRGGDARSRLHGGAGGSRGLRWGLRGCGTHTPIKVRYRYTTKASNWKLANVVITPIAFVMERHSPQTRLPIAITFQGG